MDNSNDHKSLLSNPKEFYPRNLNSLDPNVSSSAAVHTETPPTSSNTQDVTPYPPVSLPSSSSWFDLNSVNPIERAQLSTIFSNIPVSDKQQEQQYMYTRNFIVNTYRRNPREYLSVTECRKFIEGDAALLLRLHSFLDYWGIINFQADSSTMPVKSRRLHDLSYEQITETGKNSEISKWGDRFANATGGGPWKCAACGKICVYTYYILRPGGLIGVSMGVLDRCVWCLRCYAAGRYPAILNENQFLKVDLPILGGEGEGTGEWSSYETERLIDAIELYKENWDAVAQYVGTNKSARQCVAFFIQLPIQEPFFTEETSSVDDHPTVPFMSSNNPLLTQLAFLASVVSPEVATAAAKAALDAAVSCGTADLPTPPAASPSSHNLSDLAKAWETKELPPGYVSDRNLQMICGTAMAASVVRAKQLAAVEEEQIKKLMPEILDLQMKKLQIKIEHFKGLEEYIKREGENLRSAFAVLAAEQASVRMG